ncbi:MAG: CHAT domain-containing protein [Cyanophyceae cyanobacterium]
MLVPSLLLSLMLAASVVVEVTAQEALLQPVGSLSTLEHGKTLYEAGRFAEAATAWQRAAEQHQFDNDPLRQALSLSYLSLAAQELGRWDQAQQAIAQSLQLVDRGAGAAYPQVLTTQGKLQLALGQAEEAFQTWQRAESFYAQAQDRTGVLGSRINQARALQALGMYRRARRLLEVVHKQLAAEPDPRLRAIGLQNLGVTLQALGNSSQAQEVLQQSLALTQTLSSQERSATLLNLGNTARFQQDWQAAEEFYQQAIASATTPLARLAAQVNLFGLLVETQQRPAAIALLPEMKTNVAQLPPSRAAIYAQVNLAKQLIELESASKDPAALLHTALEQATLLHDPKSQSYVLGTLGFWHEQQQQWSQAQKLTQQAKALAFSIQAGDIAYQWQWQEGRLLVAQGDVPGAIAAYTAAVDTLQSLRSDLVAVPDVQFSFRDSVEPVYRELVRLLLHQPTPAHLQQAREVIESLQVAELDNFFQEACLDVQPQPLEAVDDTAAVIYPIVLRDRLAVIMSVPGQPLRYYATQLSQEQLESVFKQLFQSFNPAFSTQERLRLSQQVYDWLIRPAEADLTQIETLVFVLDSSLRNLPTAALYDGQQYLIEKYSIALTPGLQLLASQAANNQELETVLAGVSQQNQGFSALPAVETEIEQISARFSAQLLLNQEFTSANLQTAVENSAAQIVHLATHGQFSSDPQETFILTWNERVGVKEFETLLSKRQQHTTPIELLVLSACQTAAGDRRAALGLAGIAVRSGARSTLATLWSVNDASTAEFMTQFYQALSQPQVTKAEALRRAQIAFIRSSRYQHPFYWSSFVLIGNWR